MLGRLNENSKRSLSTHILVWGHWQKHFWLSLRYISWKILPWLSQWIQLEAVDQLIQQQQHNMLQMEDILTWKTCSALLEVVIRKSDIAIMLLLKHYYENTSEVKFNGNAIPIWMINSWSKSKLRNIIFYVHDYPRLVQHSNSMTHPHRRYKMIKLVMFSQMLEMRHSTHCLNLQSERNLNILMKIIGFFNNCKNYQSLLHNLVTYTSLYHVW